MTNKTSSKLPLGLVLLLLMAYSAATYTYMTLRYNGQWSEGDTTVINRTLYFIGQSGSVLRGDSPYSNGSGYPSLSYFLIEVTGLSNQTLQTYVMPYLTTFGLLIIFICYRRLLGGEVGIALLATLFVLIQPDFLFVTWRGSHEKVTWLLVFLLLYALARTFASLKNVWSALRFMLIFYIAAFALVTSNVLFAWSFVVALIFSAVSAYLLLLIQHYLLKTESDEQHSLRVQIVRVSYIVAVCLIMLYVFIFFIYPPALQLLQGLASLVQQLAVLFLNIEQTHPNITLPAANYNPYTYLSQTWSSTSVYILLTMFDWFVLGGSFITWILQIPRILREKVFTYERLPVLFLWALYPAFALQLALSILADRSNVLGGNFQVRLFTPLLLLSIPLCALGVHNVYKWIVGKRFYRLAIVAACLMVVWFSVASVLKATNEPLLSNQWLFSIDPEQEAGYWILTRTNHADVWTGFDTRLDFVMAYLYPELYYRSGATQFDTQNLNNDLRYFLLSSLEDARWKRRGTPTLYPDEQDLIYDSGAVEVIYRRPLSPFQH